MIPFVVLLLVPVLMQHFSLVGGIGKNNKKNTIALTFFFLFLTILVAFRHESVGNDTRNYILFFNQYTQMSWSEILKGALNFGKEALEFGFLLFNKNSSTHKVWCFANLSSDSKDFLSISIAG